MQEREKVLSMWLNFIFVYDYSCGNKYFDAK